MNSSIYFFNLIFFLKLSFKFETIINSIIELVITLFKSRRARNNWRTF